MKKVLIARNGKILSTNEVNGKITANILNGFLAELNIVPNEVLIYDTEKKDYRLYEAINGEFKRVDNLEKFNPTYYTGIIRELNEIRYNEKI